MEYIILTSENEWLSTCFSLDEAKNELAEIKITGYFNGEKIKANEIWLYEAKEINSIKL